jgi:hypothetical protein
MATTATAKVKDLLNKNLDRFKIIEMVEVYLVDVDGRKTNSLGFFRDQNIATAFAGAQTDANYRETRPVLVLTDGNIGYEIEDQTPVKFFDDEAEALKIKQSIIEKLSPAECELLGLKK